MGNYRARREGFLQAWQIRIAELVFSGKSDAEIAEDLWHISPDDKVKMRNARARIRKTVKDPKFAEYYKTIVTEWAVHNYGRALNKLSDQIDAKEPWLANKAANDVLTRAQKLVLGDDESTVVVKVEGMPELGSPETEED